jgi:hypothetical protein
MLDPLFHTSVVTVVASAAGLLALSAGISRWWASGKAPAPQAGVPFLIAAVGGLLATGNAGRWLALDVGVLLLAGWLLTNRSPRLAWLGACTLVAGAALLGFGPQHVPGPLWVRVGMVAATPAVAWALTSFDSRQPMLTLPLLVATTAGIYVTAPDTEQSRLVLGAAVGVGGLGWWLGARLGAIATPAVAGLLLWTAAVDGRGRHTALIGALGCLGVLVAEPLSDLVPLTVRWRWPAWGRWGSLAAVGLLQLGVVAACHAAARSPTIGRSVAMVSATLAFSIVLLVLWRAVHPFAYRVTPAGVAASGDPSSKGHIEANLRRRRASGLYLSRSVIYPSEVPVPSDRGRS